jgi:hypothetical protein
MCVLSFNLWLKKRDTVELKMDILSFNKLITEYQDRIETSCQFQKPHYSALLLAISMEDFQMLKSLRNLLQEYSNVKPYSW